VYLALYLKANNPASSDVIVDKYRSTLGEFAAVCGLIPEMAELYRRNGGEAPDLLAMQQRQAAAAAARRLKTSTAAAAETASLLRAQPRRTITAAAAAAATAAGIVDSSVVADEAAVLAKVRQWDALHAAMLSDDLPAHFVRFTR
jgi:hypothetical protein